MNIGRLVINGTEIDLGEAIPVPITYSLSDRKNPQDRKRNSSKVIKLPGTKKNKAFFFSTYKMSLSAIEPTSIAGFEFDPTQRVSAQYYKKGRKIFDGLCHLMYVTENNSEMTFHVSLFSNFVDIFMSLGKMTIAELGWSEYNHPLTLANVQASWDTSVVQDGSPVSNFTAGVPDGFGYLYPYADYGHAPNIRDIFTNDIYTHVYWKEVMEKCLAIGGMTIDSTFMDSEIFKRLTIGRGGGPKLSLSAAEVAARRVGYTSDLLYDLNIMPISNQFISSSYPGGPSGYWKYDFNHFQRLRIGDTQYVTSTVVSDTYAQFDEDTQEITILKTGNYQLDLSFILDISYSFSVVPLPGASVSAPKSTVIVYKNGAPISPVPFKVGSGTVDHSRILNLSCQSGDVIYIEVVLAISGSLNSSNDPSNPPFIVFTVEDNTLLEFNLTSSNLALIENDIVDVASFLPDMLCSDFIKGVITTFNLYFDDPDSEGVTKIEPLDDFHYGTNVYDDWSLKIDQSKEKVIYPSSMIEGKTYAYKFTQDDDYYNKLYRDLNNGIGYGDLVYEVPSTFQQGERLFQVPWAQTVPVEIPGTDIIIPTIIQVDPATGAVSPFKGKARVYYYQGLRTVTSSWVLRSAGNPTNYVTLNEYPCISHLSDYTTPEFDLNFAPPRTVWWTIVAYTLENLFTYHEKSLREMTGKDSKILVAYALLNEDDVQPDKFRRHAMINGVLYIKNLIEDFDGNGDQLCKVELIRVVEGRRRPLFSLTLTSATIFQTFTADGGTDVNGSDTGVSVLSGGKDSVEYTSNIKYGG